jgi:hypothetical protein
MKKSIIFVFLFYLSPSMCWSEDNPTTAHKDLKTLQELSIHELIAILDNDKESGSATENALEALALKKSAAAPAIPSIMALLHKDGRSDCNARECIGTDFISPIMTTLQAIGSDAKPAVHALVILLHDPKHTHYTPQILKTFQAIGSSAAEAVPDLITLAKNNALLPGQNDFREDIFATFGAIGSPAKDAVPLLIEQASAGHFTSTAIAALSRIAPNDSDVFSLFAKAFIQPRSLNLYNSTDIGIITKIISQKTSYTKKDIDTLTDEINTVLKNESDAFGLLNETNMKIICAAYAKHPEYSSLVIPSLITILDYYQENGAVGGSDIVMHTLGSFGNKAADAVPALAKKALTNGGSVYREIAIDTLKSIGTAEANEIIADYTAQKWRSY